MENYDAVIRELFMQKHKVEERQAFLRLQIGKYKKILHTHEGPTIANQGYGAVFSATTDDEPNTPNAHDVAPAYTVDVSHTRDVKFGGEWACGRGDLSVAIGCVSQISNLTV